MNELRFVLVNKLVKLNIEFTRGKKELGIQLLQRAMNGQV